MLAGTIPSLFGVALLTQGNDAFTTSLLHFKQPTGWSITATSIADDAAGTSGQTWAALGKVTIVGGPGKTAWFHRSVELDNTAGGGNYMALQQQTASVWPSGDFTIDLWVFPYLSQVGAVVAKGASSHFGPYLIYQNAGNWQFFASSNSTAWDIANGQAMGTADLNAWQHLAVQRSGNTWTTYKNGVQQATWTSALTPYQNNANNMSLGVNYDANYWAGRIDEFRFSKGIARYSGNFSVPVEPYYGVLNGGNDEATLLLLHCEGANLGTTIIDDSRGGLGTNGHPMGVSAGAITSTGNKKFGNTCFYPQNPTSRTATVNCTDFDFGNANWTVDFWYIRYATGLNVNLVMKRASSASRAPFVLADLNGVLAMFLSTDGVSYQASNINMGAIPFNAWCHIALVRDYPNYVSYINGVKQTTYNFGSALWVNNDVLNVGGSTDAAAPDTPGLFDEVRISDVARWKANFTPPAAAYAPETLPPGPNWPAEVFTQGNDSFTKLLLHGDGANASTVIPDSSLAAHGNATINGAAQLSTAQSKFGGASVFFNGAAYITYPNHADWNFGAGDFTIDFWIMSSVNQSNAIGGVFPSGSTSGSCFFYQSGLQILLYAGSVSNGVDIANARLIATLSGHNVWHHLALTRSGNTWRTFLNGVQADTFTSSLAIYAPPTNILVWGWQNGGAGWGGWLEEIRISKGVARWTANFTPPTVAYS